jgi:hypothetical protein
MTGWQQMNVGGLLNFIAVQPVLNQLFSKLRVIFTSYYLN